ncbi:MAG: hypothetical protein H6849_03190 [Alphaproteobacteria bacterium]|nr:MAG: hypothetical protein H6849_03190 [Alphaproteobacteria bacterium]
MMINTHINKGFILGLGFCFSLLSTAPVVAVTDLPTVSVDDVESKIAEIENTSQEAISTVTNEQLKNLYKKAQSLDEAAMALNDCRNVSDITSECEGNSACKDIIWDITKRCVSRYPETKTDTNFSEWLKDRLQRLLREVHDNDQKIAYLNGDINRAQAISAKALSDIATYDAEGSKIMLNMTKLDNQVTQEKIDELRSQNEELRTEADEKPSSSAPTNDTSLSQ